MNNNKENREDLYPPKLQERDSCLETRESGVINQSPLEFVAVPNL